MGLELPGLAGPQAAEQAGELGRALEREVGCAASSSSTLRGVVGWQRWREIDLRHSLGAVRVSLRRLVGEGRLPAQLVDVHAHVLLAAMTELALLIAQAEDVEQESGRADAAITGLLEGLFGAAQR